MVIYIYRVRRKSEAFLLIRATATEAKISKFVATGPETKSDKRLSAECITAFEDEGEERPTIIQLMRTDRQSLLGKSDEPDNTS